MKKSVVHQIIALIWLFLTGISYAANAEHLQTATALIICAIFQVGADVLRAWNR